MILNYPHVCRNLAAWEPLTHKVYLGNFPSATYVAPVVYVMSLLQWKNGGTDVCEMTDKLDLSKYIICLSASHSA